MSAIDLGCITAQDAEQDEDWLDFDTPRSRQPLKITPRAEPSLIQPRRVGNIPPSREWLGDELLRLSRDDEGQLYLQGELVDATFENCAVRIHARDGRSYVISDVVYRFLFFTTRISPAVERMLTGLRVGATITYNRETYEFWIAQGKQRSRVHPSTIGRALGLQLISWTGSRFELTERTVA